MDKGTVVKLREDVLERHARSVPAHVGYTREQFKWRDTLRLLEDETGVIDRTFPNSDYVTVRFENTMIGIDKSELNPICDRV